MSTTTTDTLVLSAASETKGCVFDKEVEVTLNANIKAPEMKNDEHEQRKAVDIVCVIDKSGSMSGNPMQLVKETLSFMVSQLKEGDRLSLVTFGDGATLVFGLTDMTEEGKTKALNDIRAITANGWTNLSGGIMEGIKQLSSRESVVSTTVSSVLVFTDGEANQGITNQSELVTATVNALDGVKGAVSLHTFGFSQNHNPELLTKLAEAANGMFYYLATADRIAEVFADCLGGLLSVVAMNVILEAQIEYTGAVITAIHTPFAVTHIAQGQHVSIAMGQMYSEQSRDVLFDVKLPAVAATDLDAKVMTFKLKSVNRDETLVETTAFATIDRAEADAASIKQVNEEVAKQKARVVTASAMKEALVHQAAGRSSRAAEVLTSARGKMQQAGFGVYAAQLDTAEKEVASSRTGYLWTNMRAHGAQSSAAQNVSLQEAQAWGATNDDNDVQGYSNAFARKMKTAAAAIPPPSSLPSAPSFAPSVYGNVQPQQQRAYAPQQQQMAYAPQLNDNDDMLA